MCPTRKFAKGCVKGMHKIGLIGDSDTIRGFSALGLATFEVIDRAGAVAAVQAALKGGFAVVFITERIYPQVEYLVRAAESTLPVFTVIPDNQGSTGLGQMRLRKMVERAIGVDILFKEEGKTNG
ncbi:MAG: V-type sodium ATPase subunit G [Firmicutes bacterium]|nr:V-type sodium ATPase subunit G [candidate division NPL-UPA2 bacterium]MBT9154311.1 V-type sodium ATPase subunit G [candidate division NPL-UPA2 bacterium]